MMFDKHTYSTAFPRPVQIMRQTIPNNDMGISPYAPYHGYKGLSSIKQMIVWINKQGVGRYIEDTLDTKHHIYKHSIEDMADIKVWI